MSFRYEEDRQRYIQELKQSCFQELEPTRGLGWSEATSIAYLKDIFSERRLKMWGLSAEEVYREWKSRA